MAERSSKVRLYTLSTCPWCKNTKAWLSHHDVDFGYVDYDLADEDMQVQIREEMKARNASAFPFAKFADGHFIVGYNPEAYARLLGIVMESDEEESGED